MHANKSSLAKKNGSVAGELAVDGYPFIRTYVDGRVERLLRSPFVPASEDTAANRGVATRDIVVDGGTGLSVRLFLPGGASAGAGGGRWLPVVVYFHGGSFCTESAFGRTYHSYATSLAACAGALVVSVEYRLAPEHPVPAAYDDAWAALRWARSLSDPWLAGAGDPGRTFLAGDSTGGNMAYHAAVRAGREGVDVEGLAMVQPYLWGPQRLPSEAAWEGGASLLRPEAIDKLWPFATAGEAGNDDPRIDPPEEEIADLTCRRALVAVAGRDTLRDRGRLLAARMRGCRVAGGEVTLVESEGEDHGFHLYHPLRAASKELMECIAQFIDEGDDVTARRLHGCNSTTWRARQGKAVVAPMVTTVSGYAVVSVPTRPYKAVFLDGLGSKDWSGPSATARNVLTVRRGKACMKGSAYGLYLGRTKPNKAHNFPSSAAAVCGAPMKNWLVM